MQERCDVMMQYFHWYTTDDGSWWRQLSQDAEKLADIGVSAVWLPPANKCIEGSKDAGYGSYCGLEIHAAACCGTACGLSVLALVSARLDLRDSRSFRVADPFGIVLSLSKERFLTRH